MIVKHYSNLKKLDLSKEYNSSRWFKPSGLWFTDSSEYSWLEWCKAEEFRLENLKYCFLLSIKDKRKLLVIDSIQKFEDFENKFIDKSNPYSYPDWEEITNKYSGIVIMPYFWEKRYNSWYYPWDCSSGCIWDLSLVKIVKRFETKGIM